MINTVADVGGFGTGSQRECQVTRRDFEHAAESYCMPCKNLNRAPRRIIERQSNARHWLRRRKRGSMVASHLKLFLSGIALTASLFAPSIAFAQGDETDTGEVAVLGGGTFGAGQQPAVMGSAGISLSRYGSLQFNTSFIPFGHHTIQPWPDSSTVKQSYLTDFGFDIHIQVPLKRWAPYGIVGTGLLWDVVHQVSYSQTGAAVSRGFDQFNVAFHTGGGLRYFLGENWGVRSEVRVAVSKLTYTQVSFGIFYVTPPNWP